MGTNRFLLLFGCLTLIIAVVAAEADASEGSEKGNLKIPKNGKKPGNKEHNHRERHHAESLSIMGNGNAQSGTKGRAGYLSLFSLEDDRVNIPKEDKGIKHFNGRTRRNTKEKNERPKKPCLGCFTSMGWLQRQKREDKGIKHFNGRTRRNTKKKNERPKKPCLGCFSSMARPQRQKREMTEDERRESRRHKKQHKKEWKERSKHHRHGRHRKFKIEESTGKSKGKPHTRTLSVISSINEGPRREGEGMKHHRSHKKGKHTRIHHHELPKLKTEDGE